MKFARKKSILIALLLLPLAGCDSLDLPHVFGSNEVPPEAANAPRVVTAPAPGEAQNATWMRLGDVPASPKDFTSETLIDQSKQEMRNDRATAGKMKQEADMPPPVTAPSAIQP